jgi:hypothetical protein
MGPAGITDGFVFVGADPVKVRESANDCYTALGPDTEAIHPKPLREDGGGSSVMKVKAFISGRALVYVMHAT